MYRPGDRPICIHFLQITVANQDPELIAFSPKPSHAIGSAGCGLLFGKALSAGFRFAAMRARLSYIRRRRGPLTYGLPRS